MRFQERTGNHCYGVCSRQLQEKCQEQNMDLYTTFADLTNAFDKVSHDGMWKIMEKYGCPEKIIATVQQFHDGMLACP